MIEPLLRHATTAHASGFGDACAWLLPMPTARMTAVLSPAVSRGFSGEGGLLDSGPVDSAGFDLADGTVFERELPLDARAVYAGQPRLRDARALIEAGAVRQNPDQTTVDSGRTTYVVRRTQGGERCTCAWYATHALSRGPGKHILAARLSGTR